MMQLSDLLEHPSIHDIITTPSTLFLITTADKTPPIYTDKELVHIKRDELLSHPRLPDLLAGESQRHGTLAHELRPALLYEYDVSELKNTQKQQFSHKLYGTGGRKARLKDLHGERIGRAAFMIPKDQQAPTEAFLDEHGVRFRTREVLLRGEQA